MDLSERPFYQEFEFNTSRSGGAGGQNVNKVSSKVELRFHVQNSQALSDEEKVLLQEKLANKISKEGFLQIVCQTSRSQLINKQAAVKAFYKLVESSFFRQKTRKPTKISTSTKLKRLKSKKINSEKKSLRGLNDLDQD